MAKLQTFTYTAQIRPAEPGETGFWVEVPALPGCVSQGETYEEAVANAQEAVEGFLEALVKAGQPIPSEPPPDKRIASRLIVRAPVPA